ncbi:hypothetical protein DFQ26_000615 [Actinomortierella ambigua]|nr:hypothetical protein DFQ26_000615 [Actinomortierella ambigua]
MSTQLLRTITASEDISTIVAGDWTNRHGSLPHDAAGFRSTARRGNLSRLKRTAACDRAWTNESIGVWRTVLRRLCVEKSAGTLDRMDRQFGQDGQQQQQQQQRWLPALAKSPTSKKRQSLDLHPNQGRHSMDNSELRLAAFGGGGVGVRGERLNVSGDVLHRSGHGDSGGDGSVTSQSRGPVQNQGHGVAPPSLDQFLAGEKSLSTHSIVGMEEGSKKNNKEKATKFDDEKTDHFVGQANDDKGADTQQQQ